MHHHQQNQKRRYHRAVALIGGGALSDRDDAFLQGFTGPICAADGGGWQQAQRLGLGLDAVIGDFDSVKQETIAAQAISVIAILDQNRHDFDKALGVIDAPAVLCFGFIGDRLDHSLAAFNTLSRHPNRHIILFWGADCVALAPRHLKTQLPIGARYSLFPLLETHARTRGVRYQLDGLTLAPHQRISSSNYTDAPAQHLWIDSGIAFVIIERQYWQQICEANDE